MKPVDQELAERLIIPDRKMAERFYKRELRTFLESGVNCAEMDKRTKEISTNSGITAYRRAIEKEGMKVVVVERRGKIYAYRKEYYDKLYKERCAAMYATRVISEVEEREETLKYF